MSYVVEMNHLTKEYSKAKVINDISFTLEADKIYGLLGRNGAGKTTIMHLITAQLFATSGELKVFGEHPYENEQVLRRISFVKESQKYPDIFTVKHVLGAAALFYPNWDQQYAESLIKDFNLPMKRNMKKLSRGMLSAVGIIVGLASRAPLTIFDEPYLGLDAVARNIFYDRLIEDYSKHPRTIILSTHLIDEVSQILEHVMVIDKGQILLNEDADDLRGKAYTVVGHASKLEPFIKDKNVIHRSMYGGLITATVFGSFQGDDKRKAVELGLETAPVSLQQLIVHLTGHQVGHKEANQA